MTAHAVSQTADVRARSLRKHTQVLTFTFGHSDWHEERKYLDSAGIANYE